MSVSYEAMIKSKVQLEMQGQKIVTMCGSKRSMNLNVADLTKQIFRNGKPLEMKRKFLSLTVVMTQRKSTAKGTL
ncbi:MAG: hypothetical protein ACJAT2_003784 [Bacteriovoracaceae bacterium]|jgi:hypothetical protein